MTTTVKAITNDIANALERSTMGPGHIGEVLDALAPLIARLAGQLTEDRDRANRLARELADRNDLDDTKVKDAVVEAIRKTARAWDAEDHPGDHLPFSRPTWRVDSALLRAHQIEDGEVDL